MGGPTQRHRVVVVPTGALSPGEVAYPLRAVFRRHSNVRVLMAEVTGFDLDGRRVQLAQGSLAYDTLIVAGGSRYSYFGHDDWRRYAPEVKSLESALGTRARVLGAFEDAETERDPDRRRALLTFVVVGAGPTGVEMAGQIAELARGTPRGEFRSIDSGRSQVLLIETFDRVLSTFPPSLSRKAARSLASLGVTLLLERTVVDIDEEAVTVAAPDGSTERIPARTAIWAAGVEASRLASQFGELTGAELDRAGRVTVEPDLTLPGHPEVLALGDMVRVCSRDGGFPAWAAWLVVHLFYLVGFQNRLIVFIRWFISFATRGREARLITDIPAAEDGQPEAAPDAAKAPVR